MAVFAGRLLYVTSDMSIFCWAGPGSVIDLSLGNPAAMVAGSGIPALAVGRNFALLTAGDVPQKVDRGLTSARLGGSPPKLRDIVYCAQRAVGAAADESGIIYWSGPGDTGLETWDVGVEFREAEAQPDALVAVREESRDLWAFGTRTLQVFSPDETETFAPTAGIPVGLLSRTSVIDYERVKGWLDDKRRIVICDGRVLEPDGVISSPFITSELEKFRTVSDCVGYRQRIGQYDCLVWSFAAEGRHFAYELGSHRWAEFRSYYGATWRPYLARSYCYWPEKNLHLVGLPNGQIARLSFDAHDDLGLPLKWVGRSGFSNRGVNRSKDPTEMSITMRRGEAADEDAGIEIRWRDNLGDFSQPIRKTFGTAGDYDPVVRVRPAGTPYEQREWEVSSTAAEAVVLAEALEEYEVLEA